MAIVRLLPENAEGFRYSWIEILNRMPTFSGQRVFRSRPLVSEGGLGRIPFMAVSIALRINGELRDTQTELSPETVFPIYSITKTLTAICALRLVELGSLRLDADVRQWLPEVYLPTAITLTHLLRHTSGLRDYGPLSEYHEAVRMHPARPWTRQEFLNATVSKGLLFPPGEGWAYSNIGYMLIVDILERVTGQSLARLLDEFINAPLGLRSTSVLEKVDDLIACIPGFGSEVTTDGWPVDVRGRYHPGWCAPRLVASTAKEITRLFDALTAGQVLGAKTLGQMITLAPLPGSQKPSVALGGGMGLYSNSASRYGRNYHHGGGGPGYDLSATIFPDTPIGRVAIAVFVNSSSGPRADDVEEASLAPLFDTIS
jgi:D-alanyl-D-alanine carboxypeptidase